LPVHRIWLLTQTALSP